MTKDKTEEKCPCDSCEEIATTTDDSGTPCCEECMDYDCDEDGEVYCHTHDGTLREAEDQIIEGAISTEGEWRLLHNDGTLWDGVRYATEEAALLAIDHWQDDVQNANPGTQLLWHRMDCPELGKLCEGIWDVIQEEEE